MLVSTETCRMTAGDANMAKLIGTSQLAAGIILSIQPRGSLKVMAQGSNENALVPHTFNLQPVGQLWIWPSVFVVNIMSQYQWFVTLLALCPYSTPSSHLDLGQCLIGSWKDAWCCLIGHWVAEVASGCLFQTKQAQVSEPWLSLQINSS